MAGQIIYHGDCANPPHREFLDEHLVPVVQKVLGRDADEVAVVLFRPAQIPLSDTRFDEAVHLAVSSEYPGIAVARKGEYDDAVHDGYVVALVDPRIGATWIYLTRKALVGKHWTVSSALNRLCVAVLMKQVRAIVARFPKEPVAAGAV